jgi:hypothetical protein
MARAEINKENIGGAIIQLNEHLSKILVKKGTKTFASRHEVMGLLLEEFNELERANHKDDNDEFKYELLDLAATAIFAIACVDQDTMDW